MAMKSIEENIGRLSFSKVAWNLTIFAKTKRKSWVYNNQSGSCRQDTGRAK